MHYATAMPSKPTTTTFSTSLPIEGYKLLSATSRWRDGDGRARKINPRRDHVCKLTKVRLHVCVWILVVVLLPADEDSYGFFPGSLPWFHGVRTEGRWRYDQIWQECNVVVRWDRVPCRDGGGATTAS
ncbi:hypothetical protein RIF29_21334 [Crotalaria pallida]|uniref:Uncharacterized protein n=1 Tax=Crotalaria pallida TaxID=3830 RepID=A0AAN9F2U2_CROPI